MCTRDVKLPIIVTPLLAACVWLAPQVCVAQDAAVPKGEVSKYTFEGSRIFPGTVRDYWVYVPEQYDPATPACVHVNQDGIQFNAPAVFDQLIAAKEMPVTIGVFVMHGRVKAASDQALDRFNRSYEYDGLGDNYVRFLLDELLPEVEKKTTSDGRPIRLSKNGNDRSIGGSSSGAICAFTAAWERPDAFSRVFSAIGTYVGLRGGNLYPTLIRKYEPKPIRIFLQDGSNDLNIYGGDWWMANQEMQRSLAFAGYEVKHEWGDGEHNGQHATKLFPDAMRWLWKDWPQPVKAGLGSPQLQQILIPGEEWKLVAEYERTFGGPAANAKGEVYFHERPSKTTYRVEPDGKVTLSWSTDGGRYAFGPDGRLFVLPFADMMGSLVAIDPDGKRTPIGRRLRGLDLVVRHDGSIYFTRLEPRQGPPAAVFDATSTIWRVTPQGEAKYLTTQSGALGGVTLSPDQSLLYVADSRSHWVYSYQVKPDGTLAARQKYFHLHTPDTADDAGADGLCVDQGGRLYVATRLGVQICDQAGRVNCIIPTPNGRCSNLTFGGPQFDVLYVTCGDKVFSRKVKVAGAHGWQQPHKPAAPRL
jgi:gluconolactonase